uniref:GIY-YIG domain-containing protein n=1 Tax=viral metagenome TaxID=1070528 RepID=A0A6C0BLR3_9ZZZZ
MEEPPPKNYLVYCLVSTVAPRQTYVGVTNNFKRRLRQHNGEITGGARRTRAYRPWTPFLHVSGLTKSQALQLEWALKHRRKGGAGPEGRVRTLEFLLGTAQWTKNSTPTAELRDVHVDCAWSEEKYRATCNQPLTACDDQVFIRCFECELR